MLKSRPVVLDFECSRHKKSRFFNQRTIGFDRKLLLYCVIFNPNFIQLTLSERETIIQLGVKLSLWLELGEWRLPILFFSRIFWKHSTSISLGFLCEGNRKNRNSSEISQERRYQSKDFIMYKNWKVEIFAVRYQFVL